MALSPTTTSPRPLLNSRYTRVHSVSRVMRICKFQMCLWAICISFEGPPAPFPPRNVDIDVTPHYVLVTWDPPMERNGEITMYVVSYSILPDSRINRNDVRGGTLFSRIPIDGNEGRLFKIQVQAQNHVGLGNPSTARYARIGCGRTIRLDPAESTSLTFHESEGTNKTGILCQWTLSTEDTCFLTFTFVTLQLAVSSNKPCTDAYVSIGNKGRFCHVQEEETKIISRDRNVIVIFNSNSGTSGKGFHLKIRSISVPGPPTSITTQSNDNEIILTWAPPTGLTMPITSYVISYKILPDRFIFSKVTEPNAFHFRINKKYFDGKHLLISITARIEDVEGATSDPLFVRVLNPPGPPTLLKSKLSGNAIVLSWAPPTGLTRPITSYVIHYTVQPDGRTFSTVLEPDTFEFSIDTTFFDGKYLSIYITARIADVEGVASNSLYVRALKPPGPPTSFTMTSTGNSVILTWGPPVELTLPITSYVIRYSVPRDGLTFRTDLGPNTFRFSIDTTLFEGKELLMNITAKIDDVEGVTSVPMYFKAQTYRPTALETREGPRGLTKNRSKCALDCLYAVVAAIWKEGLIASFGVLGTIAGTAANLLWEYFCGNEWNFLDRVMEYVPKWLGITGASRALIKVLNTCMDCFM